jgi:hypothetical protein
VASRLITAAATARSLSRPVDRLATRIPMSPPSER